MNEYRQYEHRDCTEAGKIGTNYTITRVHSRLSPKSIDIFAAFLNPETRGIVWIPYGSQVELEGKVYTIHRGELSKAITCRPYTFDQSPRCLEEQRNRGLDDEGKPEFYDLLYFFECEAKPTRLESGFSSQAQRWYFDLKHHKLRPLTIFQRRHK